MVDVRKLALSILFSVILTGLLFITPANAKITAGGGTGDTIGLGATDTISGFLNYGTGIASDPSSTVVFKVQDVDCNEPKQVDLKIKGYWDAVGSYGYEQVIGAGTTYRYSNPSDSKDYVEFDVASIFCSGGGGETRLITMGNVDYQQTVYVSPSGNDANNGHTDAPWATVNKAITNSIDGLDIEFRTGVYDGLSSPSYIGQSGTGNGLSNAPVVLRGDGSYPNITATGSFGGALFFAGGSNYVNVSGLRLTGSSSNPAIAFGVNNGNANYIYVYDNLINSTLTSISFAESIDDYGASGHLQNGLIYNNTIRGYNAFRVTGTGTGIFYNNTVLTSSLGTFTAASWSMDRGIIGNYWSLYTGIDENYNGIGDTAYTVGSVSDSYPIMDLSSGTVIDSGTAAGLAGVKVSQVNAGLRNTTTTATGAFNLSTIGRENSTIGYPTITLNATKIGYAENNKTIFTNSTGNIIYLTSNTAPNITSWSNTLTNDEQLNLTISSPTAIDFSAVADQAITLWVWKIDGTDQHTNLDTLSTFLNDATAPHYIEVNATNAGGTSNPVIWTVSAPTPTPTPGGGGGNFDPSGYVNDTSNASVQNAKVVLNNATFTADASFTDSSGYWHTNIYEDGVYTYTVSKQGYTTLTGSKSFAIGSTNSNFTLSGSQGVVSGHVYTNISGTGTTVITGKFLNAKADRCGVAGAGGTLTIGKSGDGSTYVLKLISVDSGNQQALWQVLKDGSVLYDNQLTDKNQKLQLKIYENFYENVYVDILVSTVYEDAEGGHANACGSLEHVSKTDDVLSFIANLANDIVMGFVFGDIQSIQNINSMFGDTTNLNPVHFNASNGGDVTLYADYHVDNRATIDNFNMALKAASSTSSAGKIAFGYTDNTQTEDNGFTDVMYINSLQACQNNGDGYCTPQHDFKYFDVNGDGTIRVWLKIYNGYSDADYYTVYMNAWGTTNQIPLPGASVYSMNGSDTVLTDALGFYQLFVTKINNTVVYQKPGYQTKSNTFFFNNTNYTASYDVVLNATNGTINTTKEYIIVPNFIQGVQTNGNYKTLSHTSLLGGYEICLKAQLGEGECLQKSSVPANTESTFAIDPSLPIGTYEADLTGYLGGMFDIGRDVIVSTNFTVTSSTPQVNWLTNPYYLGDTMVLSVYVPSSAAYVNVTYITNGTRVYQNQFSATGTVQNASFQTSANSTLNAYLPGQYQACIDGGNCDTTSLINVSTTDFTLSAPANVDDGTTFNILWKAPHTALLQIVDQNNNIRYSQDVPVGNSLTGSLPVDTTVFSHEVTSITTTLNRNGVVVATATTNITINPGSPSGTSSNITGSSSMIMNLPWVGLMLLIVVIFGLVKNNVAAGTFVFVVAIVVSIEAALGLWQQWGIYFTILSWILAGVFFKLNRTLEE